MNEMELMMQLHRNNQRQGPGSEDTTRLALTLAGINPEMSYKIADIGCGTGAQTITLAKTLKGDIVAVDLFEDFLERLKKNIAKEQTLASVRTLVASMDDLPFQNGTFDIIWSEGAVYNIGFRQGINYWTDFLKTGGILAVSELSWTTKERPAELEEFWTGEYSEMNTISEKIQILEEAGYKVLGHFILSDVCWIANYYEPLMDAHSAFLKRFGHHAMAHHIVETDRKEFDFYKKYKNYYSYGFYIAQKI